MTMAAKPKPTIMAGGRRVPNPAAARSIAQAVNLQRRNFALDVLFADIEAKQPTAGRYTRVRDAIIKEFVCSSSSAENSIRDAKVYLSEQFERDLPTKRAEMCTQLQRIADTQEVEMPLAAVAALRELSKIIGLYAPKKLEVTHGASPEFALQLDAILAVLTDSGRAALEVVMGEIEAAKREGRLLSAGGDAAPGEDDDVQDAEIVEGGEPGGPGGEN